MNLEEIQRLCAAGESETVEFKKSTTQLSRGFETLCGFLNGSGGTILFGVNDSGKLVGQDVSDATKREIANVTAESARVFMHDRSSLR